MARQSSPAVFLAHAVKKPAFSPFVHEKGRDITAPARAAIK
ncbi:hypothetical protein [Komagataeibacter europaeus]|nr:hypothetical protein [Komagataeibacter europaeus]